MRSKIYYRIIFGFLISMLFSNAFAQSTAKMVLPIGHTNYVNSATYSPDGKTLVTASEDHTAKIWCKLPRLSTCQK